MSIAFRVVDSMPDKGVYPINLTAQLLNGLRVDNIIFKHAGILCPLFQTPALSFAGIKKYVITAVPFLQQNWSKLLAYTGVATCVREMVIPKYAASLFGRIAVDPRLQIEKNSLLGKVRVILTAAAICGVTWVANRCITTSTSFFVGRHAAPWMAIGVHAAVFFIHKCAVEKLSFSQNNKSFLLNIDDTFKSLLGVKQNVFQGGWTGITRFEKLNAITDLCFSVALLFKPFVNRNPLWVNAALIPLTAVNRQVILRFFCPK